MVTMDIFIPIYFEGKDLRYYHTKKIFNYLSIIREELKKEDIILSFTVIGSNGELSRNLFNDIFKGEDDIYLEFEQKYKPKKYIYVVSPFNKSKKNDKDYVKKYKRETKEKLLFIEMLDKKFYLGWMESMKKKKDISFLMGSNDLIGKSFFIQVKDNFNPSEKQIYGINRKNYCLFMQVDSKLKLSMNNVLSIWNCQYENHPKINLAGGIIGLNNFELVKDLFEKESWNEIDLEYKLYEKGFKVTTVKKTYYLNIKTDNDLSGFIKTNTGIKLERIKDEIKNTFNIYNKI